MHYVFPELILLQYSTTFCRCKHMVAKPSSPLVPPALLSDASIEDHERPVDRITQRVAQRMPRSWPFVARNGRSSRLAPGFGAAVVPARLQGCILAPDSAGAKKRSGCYFQHV